MNEWLGVYERIASLGFPAVLFLLLVGSFADIWMWVKNHRRDIEEMTKFYETRLAEWKERAERNEAKVEMLQDSLLQTAGLLERTATRVAGKRGA